MRQRMSGIATKLVHVLTNNVRRHRCRLAGGASVLTIVVCFTLLFEGRLLPQEEEGESGRYDLEEIQVPLVGATVPPSFRIEPRAVRPWASLTGPMGIPLAASVSPSMRSTPSKKTTPSDHSSQGGVLTPRQATLSPSPQRVATLSPDNPCDPGTFPKRPTDDLKEAFEWMRVSEWATNTYVFSAHYDPRKDRRAIVVVAISSDYMGPSVVYACQVWFAGDEVAEVTPAEIMTHSETHGRKYASTFFTCNYHRNSTQPFAVSLVTFAARCRSPSNLLRISPVDLSIDPEVNFTVCVTPLNYYFNDSHQLVETIELNRMFGAQRVIFYNHTTGSHVIPYMRSYAEDGVVEIIPWKLPVHTDIRGSLLEPEIHYFGQVAALNDCLYRNMFRSRFVVFTDLDEIVVPRRHGTWMEMMESEGPNRRKDWETGIVSFHVRNVFYRTDYGEDEMYAKDVKVRDDLKLRSLLYTTREVETWPHGSRSKHIVNPQGVLLVGIHHIEAMLDYGRFTVMDVDEGAALLHHYRSWAETETVRQSSRTDRYMHGFNMTILERVEGVHRKVGDRIKGAETVGRSRVGNRTHS